jgi:hypothetical protein
MFTSARQNAEKVTTQTPSKFGESHKFGKGNNKSKLHA